MSGEKPTWLTETCPRWCVVEHLEDDQPGDRIHDSHGSELVVMVRDDESVTGAKAQQLFFVYHRRVGAGDDWLHIGSDDQTLVNVDLSPESARALARMLLAVGENPSLKQRAW